MKKIILGLLCFMSVGTAKADLSHFFMLGVGIAAEKRYQVSGPLVKCCNYLKDWWTKKGETNLVEEKTTESKSVLRSIQASSH